MSEALEANPLRPKHGRWRILDREHERVGRWLAAKTDGEWRDGATCVGLERCGQIVAAVMYDQFNGASVCMHVAAEGKRWLNREFLWYAFYYPFRQMGVNVVIGLVAKENRAAVRFDEHLGFQLHQEIPEAHPSGALLIYTMHRRDCRWLKLKGELH